MSLRLIFEELESLAPSWGLLARLAFIAAALMRLAGMQEMDVFLMLGFAIFAAVLSSGENRP